MRNFLIATGYLQAAAGLLALALVTSAAKPATAAPFCLTTNVLSPQCIYVDPAECRARAVQIHGACVANPTEMRAFSGHQAFCATDATLMALCEYPDLASCSRAVEHRSGSLCVMHPYATQPPGFSRPVNQPQGQPQGRP